jgi:hypothetical protein
VTTAQAHADDAVRRRYQEVSVVRDGDGYVLGNSRGTDFVAVPEIGGRVLRWLQSGIDPQECADRAARLAGEPVDVAGFLAALEAAGLLAPTDDTTDDTTHTTHTTADATAGRPSRTVRPGAARAGRFLFGRAGLAVQGVLCAIAIVEMVAAPATRPAYTDAIVTGVPLVSLLAVAALGTVSGLVHEYAHVLAAAARGVPGSVSIGRRLFTIVYQTDLTRLWSVPRRERVVPLLAGIVSDGATVGVLLLAEATVLRGAPPLAVDLVRAVVFIKVTGIVFQFEVFMRTDLYALFVVATGSRNLWAVKGALARRAVGRATAGDRAVLAATGGREVGWARVYLCLYVPGVAWSVWYFAVFVVPAIRAVAVMAIDAVATAGPLSGTGAAGVVALAITAASTVFVLWGLARTLGRLGRDVLTARPGEAPR